MNSHWLNTIEIRDIYEYHNISGYVLISIRV